MRHQKARAALSDTRLSKDMHAAMIFIRQRPEGHPGPNRVKESAAKRIVDDESARPAATRRTMTPGEEFVRALVAKDAPG